MEGIEQVSRLTRLVHEQFQFAGIKPDTAASDAMVDLNVGQFQSNHCITARGTIHSWPPRSHKTPPHPGRRIIRPGPRPPVSGEPVRPFYPYRRANRHNIQSCRGKSDECRHRRCLQTRRNRPMLAIWYLRVIPGSSHCTSGSVNGAWCDGKWLDAALRVEIHAI
jgi:hypothetical protein